MLPQSAFDPQPLSHLAVESQRWITPRYSRSSVWHFFATRVGKIPIRSSIARWFQQRTIEAQTVKAWQHAALKRCFKPLDKLFRIIFRSQKMR
jgi:hypothetical protein